jgi:two-component system, LytTR family, response regulator
VLLVDDERLARQELRSMLAAHPEIEVVGEAATIDAAVAAVRAEAPDAVFLDVHMPPDSGFALFERLGVGSHTRLPLRIVFVTAHDAYAVRAFEVNALDYLLKPVHPDRLADAVHRLLREPTPASNAAPAALRPFDYADRVFVESAGRARFVALDRVAAVRAAGDYSELVTIDADVLLVSRSMREWEARLPSRQFTRIHRSTIVNLEHVDRVEPASEREYRVWLRGVDAPASMSRRYAARLRERFA